MLGTIAKKMSNVIYMIFVLAAQCVFATQASKVEENQKKYESMNAIGLEAGTDKSSSFHNYTQVYSQYLDHLRNDTIRFLEIGIYKGASVKMWEKYLPNADRHFIDITSEFIEYYSPHSKYHFFSQTDVPALTALANSLGQFDVIIDDGGHTMEQQKISFETLFPFVKSGGIYIIEDLHTSYWKEYGGAGSPERPRSGSITTTAFLQRLVDSVNFVGAASRCADFNKAPDSVLSRASYYQKHIYSMHFYDSVCVIIKR